MKKYLLSLTVLVVAVAAMAFTNVAVPEERAVNQYRFTGTLESQVDNPSFWTKSTAQLPGCTEGGLPCYVLTDMAITDWLNARSNAEIIEDADARKN